MTLDEHEVNEKIARWIWPDAVLHWADDDGLTRELNGPLYVENITFTRSLDAQVVRVWPKLAEEGWRMELTQLKTVYYAHLLDRNGNDQGHLIGIDQYPAMATTQAIGELIERGA